MLKNDYIPFSDYYANAVGRTIAETENNYGISLTADTGNTGTGGCSCQTCQTNCESGCASTCKGSCSGSCSGGCSGTCKGTCTGTCSTTCTGNCAKTCIGGCETYCANDCQTYCQSQQTYSKNTGKNNPGGKVFTWDTTVSSGKTIYLTATEWNRLAGYIEEAAKYCSTSSVSISRVSSKDPIYASYYNSMNNGVNTIGSSGETNKTANIDLITASNIDALRTGYNNAKIISSLPSNPSGASNLCCQIGEACMTQAQGRPSLQPCTQTPGK